MTSLSLSLLTATPLPSHSLLPVISPFPPLPSLPDVRGSACPGLGSEQVQDVHRPSLGCGAGERPRPPGGHATPPAEQWAPYGVAEDGFQGSGEAMAALQLNWLCRFATPTLPSFPHSCCLCHSFLPSLTHTIDIMLIPSLTSSLPLSPMQESCLSYPSLPHSCLLFLPLLVCLLWYSFAPSLMPILSFPPQSCRSHVFLSFHSSLPPSLPPSLPSPPPQLLEELQERERNTESLQNYASLLVQRVMEQAPDLIPSVVQLQETVGMEPDSVWEE